MADDSEWIKLPTDEKCQHKAWKARIAGYEEAIKTFNTLGDEKSPEFSKYLGLIKKFVVDNNAIAQEKGLEATLAYIENYFHASKTAGEVCNGIISKCLNQRPKTQTLGMAILMAYIEAERQEIVQDELMKGLANKQPKIIASCITCLREALRDFGPKIISIKPIVKQLHVLLEDRDKLVRDEAKLLTVEIYRWIGQAIKPQLTSVKPLQLTELEQEFEKLPNQKPQQTKFLRSQQDLKAKMMQQNNQQQAQSSKPEAGDCQPVAEDIDPYDLLDAVDILSKIPKDFYEKIEEKKWQDRKEALDSLQKLCEYPKLENGDYNEILRTLRKVVAKDANVMLVAIAAKCISLIAIGLRKKFASYAPNTIEVLLEKFKEKKQNVVVILREAVDACFLSTNLEMISEACIAALDHKTPSVKAETASFLARCFSKCTPITLPKKMLKLFVNAFLKTVNDTAPEVREASFEALGTAMKVISEKALLPFLSDVDHLKMAKIKECCEKVTIVGKSSNMPTVSTESVKVKPNLPKSNASTAKKPESQSASSPSVKKKKVTTVKGKKAVAEKELFNEKEIPEEEVDEKMLELFPVDVVPGLVNNNWKERLASMEKIFQVMKSSAKEDIPTQVIIRSILKKPGLKDNNFQVLKLKVELISLLASKANFSRRSGEYVLPDLIEKIGDSKNGEVIKECLLLIAEATSLDFVAQQVLDISMENKNPKNQSEALTWTSQALREFGLKVGVKSIVEVIKKAISSPNPNTRTSGISLLGVMYIFMGPTLRVLFENEKPAVLQLIDVEINKVKDEKPMPAVRGLKRIDNSGNDLGDDGDENEEENINVPVIADLIPRVNISDKLTEQLLTELGEKDWKVRKEALEKLQAILNEAKFIEPSIGNLPEVLKPRLIEANKILAMIALNICQLLCTSMGSPIKQYARSLTPGIISNLGDAKINVRHGALATLNSLLDAIGPSGLAYLIEAEIFSDALKIENPILRAELLGWLSEKLPKYKKLPNELQTCIVHLYACIEDRNADVRKKAADAVLPFMIQCGYETMLNKVTLVKPSSKDVIQKALELARTQLPAKPTKVASSMASTKPTISSINAMQSSVSDENLAKDNSQKTATIEPKSKLKLKEASTISKKGGANAANTVKKKGADDEDNQPPIKVSNGKEQRAKDEKNLKVFKWNFDFPRKEFIDQLQMQMEPTFSKAILDQLFHADFKLQIKAVDILLKSCEESLAPTISNLDLILKWITLRFFDTNTTILLKCLEYLLFTMQKLVNHSYQLTDVEAVSFIPYLVNKVGDPKDNIRKDIRCTLQYLCHMYSVPKITNYILDGLKSKNSKQRAECLEELSLMLQVHGISIFQPSVTIALKIIATQISDRENNVRSSALNCIVNAYNIMGEAIFKQIGTLNEKDMSMLEERIKRSVKSKPQLNAIVQINNNNKSPHEEKRSQLKQPQAAPKSEIEVHGKSVPRREGGIYLDIDDEGIGEAYVMPKLIETNLDDILNQPILLPVTRCRISPQANRILQKSPDAKVAIDIVISQIPNHDINACLSALNQLDVVLRDETQNESLAGHIDHIVTMCTMQLRLILSNYLADQAKHRDAIRLTKSILALFDSICKVPMLAKEPKREVIKDLHFNLVSILNDSRLNETSEKNELSRTINFIVMKIIDSMDLTNTLCALIRLMQELVSVESSAKLLELVMKSIWHLVRTVPSKINYINIDELLLEMHVFLKLNPSSSFRNKNSDLPLRTIKTILHHLASTKKEKSTDCDSALIPLLSLR